MEHSSADNGQLTAEDRGLILVALGSGHSIPESAVAEARLRAFVALEKLLADQDLFCQIRHSPLGPEWSSDLDVHCSVQPDPVVMHQAGWYPLDHLLDRLGHDTDGRWAIVVDGKVVGAADFTTADFSTSLPNAVAQTLRRAGTRPTLRHVLELRVLQRSGALLPTSGDISYAAALERSLGGDEIIADELRPIESAAHTGSGAVRSNIPRPRRNRFVLAVSGVDGAGKSSVVKLIDHELFLAGVRSTRIWSRPGQQIGWLDAVARAGKGVLRRQQTPGVGAVVRGEKPTSRSGLSGRLWAWLMVAHYVVDLRRRFATAQGVVIFDRSALDSVVSLAALYELEHPRMHAFLRRAVPTPDVHVFLQIDAQRAATRKPDDPMVESVVSEQIRFYEEHLPQSTVTTVLDATRPLDEVVENIWNLILD